MTSVKTFIRETQRSNIMYKKRKTINSYEPHQQTTTSEQQVHDLGQF